MRDSDLQQYVSEGAIVVEATRDRYIFWVIRGDNLIEVPTDCVKAIIAGAGSLNVPEGGQ